MNDYLQTQLSFLKELKEEEFAHFEKNIRNLTYKKGETIVKQNANVSDVFFIRQGLVKIIIEGYNEKNIILRLLPPNNYIGLSSIFADNYHHYTATALKITEVVSIEKQVLIDLCQTNTAVANYVFRQQALSFTNLFNKLKTIGTKQFQGRLAETILYLNSEEMLAIDAFSSLSRRDIADLAGMSLDSMMRILNEYKEDKVIIIEGKKIKINDQILIEKLQKIG